MGMNDVKFGTVSALLSPYICGKLGKGKATIFYCQGNTITAQDAYERVLVDDVADNLKEAHAKIDDMCESLTKCGPQCMNAVKDFCQGLQGFPITEYLFYYCSSVAAKNEAA